MADYAAPQPDAIELRLLAYEPPAPEALQFRLGAQGSEPSTPASIAEGGVASVGHAVGRVQVAASITGLGVSSTEDAAGRVTVAAAMEDAGVASTGGVAGRVVVAATIVDPGVTSTGHATNRSVLRAVVAESGVGSGGTVVAAVHLRATLSTAGTPSAGRVEGTATWPGRTASLAGGGVASAGAAAVTVRVAAAANAGGTSAAGSIAAAVHLAAALAAPGGVSTGEGTIGTAEPDPRTAVIEDPGVTSRGWIAAVATGSGGNEVPQELSIEEKHGRVLSDQSAELTYIIRHTHDDAVARQAVLDASPSSWRGKGREDAEVEEIGHQLWLGTVRYSERETERQQAPEPRFSFETRGGSQHISQSLETVGRYAAAGLPAAPDFGGAIGVQDDQIQGCEITVPVYTFTETHYFDEVATAYKSTLFYLTGRVNSASFKGLDAGEALFLGAAGTKPGDEEPWEITFAFAGSPNVSGLSIGTITGVAKKGWEYLWVRYAEAEDTAAKMLIRKPIAAYVERVYREGDFSLLGIGV